MSKLFQFAAIWTPTTEERKEGKREKLVVPVSTVLANDQQTATILAGREIPKEYLDSLDQVQVVVRPF